MSESIKFSGYSMYPCLRPGDVLEVEFFDSPKSLENFPLGSLLVHRDRQEFMVHRLMMRNGKRVLKSDWTPNFWEHSALGKVTGATRNRARVRLDRSSTFVIAASGLTGGKIRPLRWLGKSMLCWAYYL